MAVVDATGKLVAADTIYPHTGAGRKAAMTVAALCEKHNVELVAIRSVQLPAKPNVSISTCRSSSRK
ncbi:hypothetical protein ACLK1Z_19420 [Escherichia coli]